MIVNKFNGNGGGGGSYTLPTATSSRLGGVKIGEGINVQNDGTISVTGGTGGGGEVYYLNNMTQQERAALYAKIDSVLSGDTSVSGVSRDRYFYQFEYVGEFKGWVEVYPSLTYSTTGGTGYVFTGIAQHYNKKAVSEISVRLRADGVMGNSISRKVQLGKEAFDFDTMSQSDFASLYSTLWALYDGGSGATINKDFVFYKSVDGRQSVPIDYYTFNSGTLVFGKAVAEKDGNNAQVNDMVFKVASNGETEQIFYPVAGGTSGGAKVVNIAESGAYADAVDTTGKVFYYNDTPVQYYTATTYNDVVSYWFVTDYIPDDPWNDGGAAICKKYYQLSPSNCENISIFDLQYSDRLGYTPNDAYYAYPKILVFNQATSGVTGALAFLGRAAIKRGEQTVAIKSSGTSGKKFYSSNVWIRPWYDSVNQQWIDPANLEYILGAEMYFEDNKIRAEWHVVENSTTVITWDVTALNTQF